MYQAVPGSQSSIPVNWFHSVRQSLTHPGLNHKMAGEEWQRFFNSTTVRKDQVDARSEEGVPLGKALVSSTDWIYIYCCTRKGISQSCSCRYNFLCMCVVCVVLHLVIVWLFTYIEEFTLAQCSKTLSWLEHGGVVSCSVLVFVGMASLAGSRWRWSHFSIPGLWHTHTH